MPTTGRGTFLPRLPLDNQQPVNSLRIDFEVTLFCGVRFTILGQATIAVLETRNPSGCAKARNRLNRKQEGRTSPPQVSCPIRTASESKHSKQERQ